MRVIDGRSRHGTGGIALAAALLVSACATTTPQATSGQEAQPVAVQPMTAAEAVAAGDSAWRGNNPDQAAVHYLMAADIDPASETPLLRMGSLYEARKQHDLALRAYEGALLRAPGQASIHESMGFVLLREGRLEPAIAAFREATQREPTRWRSQMGLGLSFRRQGNSESARLHMNEALRLQPRSPELLAYSAELWLDVGYTEAALRQARESQALAPNISIHLLLGDCLARGKDFTGGFEAYLQVLSESSAYERIGEEAMRASEYDRAVRYFQEALRTSSSFNDKVAKRLSVARERQGEQRERLRARS